MAGEPIDRVLVTDGAGFVGSHAAAYYDDQGSTVTALDNLSRVETLETADDNRDTAAYNWQHLQREHPSIELVEADVREASRLEAIVEGHDAIVHTAGQVAVTSSIQDPGTDFETNAEGTFNVLETAWKAESNPPVAFASTNKVYGDNVNDISVREESRRYIYDDAAFEDGIPETLLIDGCEHIPTDLEISSRPLRAGLRCPE